MFDYFKEKYSILPKLGSFYYKILNTEDKIASKLSKIAYQTTLYKRFSTLIQRMLGKKVMFDGFNKVLNFKDTDIIKESDVEFTVKVPDSMYITSIQLDNGDVLFDKVNFQSKFGSITVKDSPINLFHNMTFTAKHYYKKLRNINCYRLGLQDVYGDVSHIQQFYKNNQSLHQFSLAVYRSVDIPVGLQDAVVHQIIHNVAIDSEGNQYNNVPSTLKVGDVIRKDQILGDQIKIYLPGDKIPSDIVRIYPTVYSISGRDSLYLVNKKGKQYNSQWFYNAEEYFKGDSAQNYNNFINSIGKIQATDQIKQSDIQFSNSIEFIRKIVAPGRCIVLHVNKSAISYEQLLRLKSFIIDNLPIGAIVFMADTADDLEEVVPVWDKSYIDLAEPSDLFTQDDSNITLEELNLNSQDGFTVAVGLNWTGVSAGPLLWISNQYGQEYNNSLCTIGWRSNINHAGLFNLSGSSGSCTDEFVIGSDSLSHQRSQYIRDYIPALLGKQDKNNSLKDKQLVYFITSKNGSTALYELTSENSIQLISQQGGMKNGIAKYLTVGHWNMETPQQLGTARVQMFDRILDQMEMLKAAQDLL